MAIRKRSLKALKETGLGDREIEMQQALQKKAEDLEESLEELSEQKPTKEVVLKKSQVRKELNRVALTAAYWGVHPNDVPLDDLKSALRTPDFDDNIEITYRTALAQKPSLKRAVRTFCVLCTGGSQKFVSECSKVNCPLWPFRMGKNPFSTRRGVVPKHLRKDEVDQIDDDEWDDDIEEDDNDDMILDVEDAKPIVTE